MSADVFGPHVEAVARHFWGEPNAHASSQAELRFGAHGSKSVDLEKGTWFDHEAAEGGGVLDLVAREANLKNGEAATFLKNELGLALGDAPGWSAAVKSKAQPRRIVAAYDYATADGEVIFEVVRYEPKTFRQRRPATKADDPSSVRDGYVWSVKGVTQVPYRLPELINATETGGTVYLPEGEKDVDALWAIGVPASCNAMGAGKWPAELSEHFRGLDVVILPDNDDAGRGHLALVGEALTGVANSVRSLDLPGLDQKQDVSDWIDAGGDAAALQDLTERQARRWGDEPPATRYGAVLWRDLPTIKIDRQWQVEGLMFPRDISINYGESGAGKSFLQMDLAMAIARGTDFFGMPTRRGAVVYQAGEGSDGAVSRLRAYGAHNEVTAEELPFVLLRSRVDLFAADGDVDGFIAECLAWQAWLKEPLAMITIDTWSAATPGADENASKDVSTILTNGKRIRDVTGAAVSFVHHKNAGGLKHRGHTSIYADADMALDVSIDPDTRERSFKVQKVKDGESGMVYGFQLQSTVIGTEDGKANTSCVVVPVTPDTRTSDRAAVKPVTSGQVHFLRALLAALTDKGGIAPPNVPTEDPYTRVIDWTTFRRHYEQMGDPERDSETIRKALLRDGDALLKAKLIGRHKPFVWLTEAGRRRA